MLLTIDERYLLKYHGGVIQTITIKDDCLIRIEFEIYEENEEGIVYSKLYPSAELAIQSIKQFLAISIKGPAGMGGTDRAAVLQEVTRIKIKLFQDAANNAIPLPDNGEGYLLKNDKQYLLAAANILEKALR